MNFLRHVTLAVSCMASLICLRAGAAPLPAAPPRTENVFLIISDGLRWQEIFNGAEEALLNKTNGGVKNVPALQAKFWRSTPELRRAALFPFLWGEVARRGQLYGNQAKGSTSSVTNTRKFSYPGYNEILSGYGDPRIETNDKKPNPNLTVFEWLGHHPRLRKRVVAFGTWDVFPYIFNCERSGIPIWPAWEPRFEDKSMAPSPVLLSLMKDTTPIFEDLVLDTYLFHAVSDYIPEHKPRLAFIGFGETDEWAHAGRYDLYLEAAHNVDRSLQSLWESVQKISQYRDKTTFIITCDHGRGAGLSDWKDHGAKVDKSEGTWLAVLGPDTPPLGERTQTAPVTHSQIAASIAAFFGEDYHEAFPSAGSAIPELLTGTSAAKVKSSK
jgi:hypothetical protein